MIFSASTSLSKHATGKPPPISIYFISSPLAFNLSIKPRANENAFSYDFGDKT